MTKGVISDVISFLLCLPYKGDTENMFPAVEIKNSASTKTSGCYDVEEVISIIAVITVAAPK